MHPHHAAPRLALALAAFCLLAAPTAAQDETPPENKPAPTEPQDPPKDGGDDAGGAPQRPEGRRGGRLRGGEAPRVPPATQPLTLERAYQRLGRIRRAPLRQPGSLAKRLASYKELAEKVHALPEAENPQGEDVFRLAEIQLEAEELEAAAALYQRYLAPGAETPGAKSPGASIEESGTPDPDAAEPPPPAEPEAAWLGLVRALTGLDRTEEAAAALKSFRSAFPDGDQIPVAGKVLGDCLIRAARPKDALDAYRAALDDCRPRHEGARAGLTQAIAATLMALGDIDKETAFVQEGMDRANPKVRARYEALLERAALVGKPYPVPTLPHWTGGKALEAKDVEGKVVVIHVFSWWMESRRFELKAWVDMVNALPEDSPLVFVPVTRTAGYDAATQRFQRGGQGEEEEIAAIEKMLSELGWKGPVGIGIGRNAFDSMGVRGIPAEFVIDKSGNVRFARASGESGGDLARLVARALLDGKDPGVRLPGAAGAGSDATTEDAGPTPGEKPGTPVPTDASKPGGTPEKGDR